mgnify:CR=1 FL=1
MLSDHELDWLIDQLAATAELLAAQMTGGRLPLNPASFAAQRFSLPA